MDIMQDRPLLLKQIEFHRWNLPVPLRCGEEVFWVVKHSGEIMGRSRCEVRWNIIRCALRSLVLRSWGLGGWWLLLGALPGGFTVWNWMLIVKIGAWFKVNGNADKVKIKVFWCWYYMVWK